MAKIDIRIVTDGGLEFSLAGNDISNEGVRNKLEGLIQLVFGGDTLSSCLYRIKISDPIMPDERVKTIKQIREATGLGLRESKDIADRLIEKPLDPVEFPRTFSPGQKTLAIEQLSHVYRTIETIPIF